MVAAQSTGSDVPANEAELERAVEELLDDRQPFTAYDLARQGIERHPDSVRLRQLGALALLQTGAVEEARRLLEALPNWATMDDAPFHRLYGALRDTLAAMGDQRRRTPTRAALAAVAQLTKSLDEVRGRQLIALSGDAATIALLARLTMESWRHSGDTADLQRCRDLWHDSFKAGGDVIQGINAAATSRLLGDLRTATRLARAVLAEDAPAAKDRFWTHAARGLAHLLLFDEEAALSEYSQAAALSGDRYRRIVAARQQLLMLQENGLQVPAPLLEVLRPPSIVAFTGPMLDRPGQPESFFPPHIEHALREEIDRRLDVLHAQIGYASASCGSDLLFIEAMLERGAEVNIVLPFELEDFVACNVAYGGPRWERRFRNAIKLASSVSFAAEERFLGHEQLFRFGNQVLHGLAMLRSQFLSTSPHLLVVWDLMSGSLPGGAADFIDHWGDVTRLHIIDIDDVKATAPAPAEAPPEAAPGPPAEFHPPGGLQRTIKGMLFADLVGYSALQEEHIPGFLEFMQRLHAMLAGCGATPEFVHTWGDALFAVTPTAARIAEFALALQATVSELGGTVDGLPRPLGIRISLHAGPVFEANDPFTGGVNCYGKHINRAARLEPVTVPGHVYATQQFVALLAAEQSEERTEAERGGRRYAEKFVCEYVGILPLAKQFGREPVYHLRRNRKA